MTTEIPEWVAAEGNVAAYFLPAAVNLEAITVSEFAAGVNLTCFMPEMFDGIAGEQAKGEQTRACLRETFEVLGRIKRSVADVTYTVLPQAADNDPANKVSSMLGENVEGVVVIRRGPDAQSAIAVAQKYSAIRVVTGLQNENVKGADEFSPITNTSSFSTSGALAKGVVAA